MTSCSLRPARRARNAPAVWIPSCEFPASRITASRMLSGRKSARSPLGAAVCTAVSGRSLTGLETYQIELPFPPAIALEAFGETGFWGVQAASLHVSAASRDREVLV